MQCMSQAKNCSQERPLETLGETEQAQTNSFLVTASQILIIAI